VYKRQVINIITKKSERSRDKEARISGSVSGRFDSATDGWGSTSFVEGGQGPINYFLGLNYTDTENVETPDGELNHSFYNGGIYSGGINYTGENSFFGISGFVNNADIGRPDSAQTNCSESYFKDEKHHFVSASYELKNISDLLTAIKINSAFQKHNRHYTAVPEEDKRINIFHDIDTWNFNSQFTFKQGNLQTIVSGFQFFYEDVTSDRECPMPAYNKVPVVPDSNRLGIGAFAQDEFVFTDRFKSTLGLRYDMIHSSTEGAAGHAISESSSQSDHSVSGNISFLYALIKNRLNITANGGRAFRSPTILERYFYGPHGGTFDVGNPSLKPEVSWNADAGLKIKGDFFHAGFNGFFNYIDNYIEKYKTGTEESLPRWTWDNRKKVYLYGFEGEGDIQLPFGFSVFGNVSFMIGENKTDNTALTSIPPFKGNYGIRYDQRSAEWNLFWCEISAQTVAAQHRNGIGEKETDGYTVADLRFGVNLLNGLDLSSYVKNITDKAYHDHLSSSITHMKEQPGRSFGMNVKYSF